MTKCQYVSPEAQYFTRCQNWLDGLHRVDSREFWQQLNPGLRLTDTPFSEPARPYAVAVEEIEKAVEQSREEGYLHTQPVLPRKLCSSLALAVERIIEAGLHPIYLGLYDEYWQVLRSLARVLGPVLGEEYHPLGDFWCWCISPQTAPSGWGPHRDLQFRVPTLRPDRRPTLITCWLPFTDTDPLNGCIYLLPMNCDPAIPLEMDRTHFRNYQDIRALPAQAGSVLAWNQYVLHWGGTCSKWAKNPRISTGIYLQSGDREPYVDKLVSFDQPLSFEKRLAMIASNLLNYEQYHHYPDAVLEMSLRQVQHLSQFTHLIPAAFLERI